MNRRDFLRTATSLLVAPGMAAGVPPARAISAYEDASRGHVGVYAENLKTRATWTWRADERFVMCSTFKASLAACVLSRVDQGYEDLERRLSYGAADIQADWWAPVAKAHLTTGAMTVREMCSAAVSFSDNTCANVLLASIGGPQALNAFWRRIGDEVSRLDVDEPELNRTPLGKPENTTTPAAMAGTLRRLVLGDVLTDASRSLLTDWLVGCQTGFNRLRAGLPADWRIGDKTGNNGADAAGDVAIAWPTPDRPIVICVYTRGGTPTDAHLAAAFSGIARTAVAKLV